MHITLVQLVVMYIKDNYMTSDAIINIDAPNQKQNKPPTFLDGYSPDIFVKNKSIMIIGEAKTEEDALRTHSINQYKCYLSECNSFIGDAFFILAAPWSVQISLSNKLRKLCKDIGLDKSRCVVLNQIGDR